MNFKKPKFWDNNKGNFFAYLLFPFSILYEFINFLRLFLIKRNTSTIKTICLGNFYLGGTGKTSLAITLKKIIEKKYKVCFIKKFHSNQLKF